MIMDTLFIILTIVYIISVMGMLFVVTGSPKPFDITFWSLLMVFCPVVNTVMIFVLGRGRFREFFSFKSFVKELKTKL